MNKNPHRTPARLLGLALLVAFIPESRAADHYDGEVTAYANASDISDFYAFPVTADGATRLALIMDTSPRAGVAAHFSDAVIYGFRIRPSSLERTESGVAQRLSDHELRVSCVFDVIDDEDLSQQARCRLLDGSTELASSEVRVDDESGGSNPDFRVFAGLRADPFFTDAVRIRLPRPRYKSLPSLIGTGNSMRPARLAVGVKAGGPDHTKGQLPNVLSLVVELDVDKLLAGSGTSFGVVAETSRRPVDEGAAP